MSNKHQLQANPTLGIQNCLAAFNSVTVSLTIIYPNHSLTHSLSLTHIQAKWIPLRRGLSQLPSAAIGSPSLALVPQHALSDSVGDHRIVLQSHASFRNTSQVNYIILSYHHQVLTIGVDHPSQFLPRKQNRNLIDLGNIQPKLLH